MSIRIPKPHDPLAPALFLSRIDDPHRGERRKLCGKSIKLYFFKIKLGRIGFISDVKTGELLPAFFCLQGQTAAEHGMNLKIHQRPQAQHFLIKGLRSFQIPDDEHRIF